jgi:hypothetical protein
MFAVAVWGVPAVIGVLWAGWPAFREFGPGGPRCLCIAAVFGTAAHVLSAGTSLGVKLLDVVLDAASNSDSFGRTDFTLLVPSAPTTYARSGFLPCEGPPLVSGAGRGGQVGRLVVAVDRRNGSRRLRRPPPTLLRDAFGRQDAPIEWGSG